MVDLQSADGWSPAKMHSTMFHFQRTNARSTVNNHTGQLSMYILNTELWRPPTVVHDKSPERHSRRTCGLRVGHLQAVDIKQGIETSRGHAGCEQCYAHDERPPKDQRIRQPSNLMTLYIRPRCGTFFGDRYALPTNESSRLL